MTQRYAKQHVSGEDRLEEENVGQMAGSLVRVVVDEYVAGLDVITVDPEDSFQGRHDGAQVNGYG